MQREFGIEVTLTPGGRGEYTVWLDGQKIADKAGKDFPTEAELIAAARAQLAQ